MSRPTKRINNIEKKFADLIIESGLGCIEAARKTFGWRCEPGSSEERKAINLRKTPRIEEYIQKRQEQVTRETEAHKIFLDTDSIEWDRMRKFCFDRLVHIRDNPQHPSQVRFNAIRALEKLSDPSTDTALINMWLSLLWRGAMVHCPCCHTDYPMAYLKNTKLDEWKEANEEPEFKPIGDTLERRLQILTRADKRRTPHPGQTKALSADERNIVVLAPARAGKSRMLAWFAALTYLIPGVEIWVLARIYEDARSEVEYIEDFLNSLFYPFTSKLVKRNFDTKTGELILTSKWGSEIRVRSAKAKGSITGRELEMALVAEPGWVPDDIYEELRARMVSRLGRILLMGTPKGYGGILGRVIRLVGKDPVTGKLVKMNPADRTLEAGCPWNISLLLYSMKPEDNPEYVKSELGAARFELMDTEYASEFEGKMVAEEGAKFPLLKDRHLTKIPFSLYEQCVFVVGVDQGQKNFAATLVGFTGRKVICAREYFESDIKTIKYHMNVLKNSVPAWIRKLGGDRSDWKLTIFDADPPVINELQEFEDEGKPWPTDFTFRPKNKKGEFRQENWRAEVYEYMNNLCVKEDPDVLFDIEHCELLHDQLMRAQNKPEDYTKENPSMMSKGWIINDPWRGDHVADSFMLALWTIFSQQILKVPEKPEAMQPFAEHKAAFDYSRELQEKQELTGFEGGKVNEDDIFEKHFGRRPKSRGWFPGPISYSDYS